MPKKGQKRKADVELASDESDSLLVQDDPLKNTAAKNKKKRLARLEEYEKDEGRAGSRGFQQWAEIFEKNTKGEVSKSKEFMKAFRDETKKQADEVRDYMRKQENQLTKSGEKFVKVFERLHSTSVLPPGTTSKEGHVLFKETQKFISGGYALLKHFKDTEEGLKNQKLEFPTERWKNDKQELKEILAGGRQEGEKLAEGILAPDTYTPSKPGNYMASPNEQLVSDLFKESRKFLEQDNWGTVAVDQVKKLTALAKIIPPKNPDRTKPWF
ncbi:hypothetical protein F4779DRAFT_640611 [Xylariaceae sp. FL0662B]|nr:hypothetical protein F4779DRAFT_640611 [Xylariaceae sp. FL0662B]